MAPRPRLRIGSLALAGGIAASIALTAGPSQAATTRYGNDVSWPQCSKAQGGYGLPMPAPSAAFVVIGTTQGLPFTANPCLAEQVAWAATRSVPAQAYTIPAFPTAAQLSAYGSAGPWSPTTRWARLANTGYAEGSHTLARLAAAKFSPRMIWVDVEARGKQPWPTGSRLREAENRAVITGMLRRLADTGTAYGIYTNASGWQTITGSWRLPGVPAWATVGRRGQAAAAATCTRPGVTGAVPQLAQWFDDTRDSDLTCPSFQAAPPMPYPPAGPGDVDGDLDGDWSADLLARDPAGGSLWLYPKLNAGSGSGSGAGSVAGVRRQIGSGWGRFDVVVTPGDLTGDGVPDVLARDAATGALLLYPRSRTAGWLPVRTVGQGWGGMDAVLGVGDFSGDAIPDVVARDRATGNLLLYRGTGRGTVTGAGTLGAPVQLGQGWGVFDRLLAPGDFDGDGKVDVLGRRADDGSLRLYRGDGKGGWLGASQVGVGWAGFDALALPGDVTRDGTLDLVARERATGRLWLYPTDGNGHWRPRSDLGLPTTGLELIE